MSPRLLCLITGHRWTTETIYASEGSSGRRPSDAFSSLRLCRRCRSIR